MNFRVGILTLALTLTLISCTSSIHYPMARQSQQVDTLHGVTVADPYRWLEDPDSPETRAWINAENKLTASVLSKSPYRDSIRQRLTTLWNYEKHGLPSRHGDRYFFSKNSGLQNHPILYWSDDLTKAPTPLLDPNTFSDDGTVALANWQPSHDGKWLAYGVSSGGSDWVQWKVLNVKTGKHLPDELHWTKFTSAAWTHDNLGFFYSRYNAPSSDATLEETNYFNKLYYHRLGTSQDDDQLIHEAPHEKEWGFSPQVSNKGDYLIVSVWKGTDDRNQILYKKIKDSAAPLTPLIPHFKAGFHFIGNEGSTFFFQTTSSAPRGRLISIDLSHPEETRWKELIPQNDDTLESATMVGSRLVLRYLHNAHNVIKLHRHNGAFVKQIQLPGIGSVFGLYGDRTSQETFFGFTGFTTPTSLFRLQVASGEATPFWSPKVQFDPKLYETRQVFYKSKDGTPIPLFISHKKGLQHTGSTPTLLYGYGGFNISIKPRFSVSSLVWMEMGGIYAVANIRGGGEFGEEWHKAGTKTHKQNVFDDFQAAARWLTQEGYTRPDRLGIQGSSNGGLLVGACLVQAPELYGAALPGVGVLDMLRFHQFTIGWAWTDDYGSVANKDEFEALLAYSPLHNITPNRAYPPTLITTADHDDRVVPAHSFKFAAAMQAAQGGSAPILIRIDTRSGHGAGTPTSKRIQKIADKWAFLVDSLDFTPLTP